MPDVKRIGVDEEEAQDVASVSATAAPAKSEKSGSKRSAKKDAQKRTAAQKQGARQKASEAQIRAGSKQAKVVELLKRSKGATLDELVEATDWLPHTTRTALTGLRKRGLTVERVKDEGRGSVYRIRSGATAAAA
jgi:hypothetical protein